MANKKKAVKAKKKPAKAAKKVATKKVTAKKASKKKLVAKKAQKKKAEPKKAAKTKQIKVEPKKKSKSVKVKVSQGQKVTLESAKSQQEVEFKPEHRIQRQKDVAWRMIDGEAVIITPADNTMHTLNDVGTRIWELITGNRTLSEVAQVLCAEFEVDKDRAEKDTLWFAECLAKKGLVELIP